MKYTSFSDKETKQIGKTLAKKIKGIIALEGELGVGKTTFVQGFAKGLGIKDKIISPTFVLHIIHKIPDSNEQGSRSCAKLLHHIDLYRLEDEKSFKDLGLEDLFSDPNNIVLIEWAEKIKKMLPKNTTKIGIGKLAENHGSSNKRQITIS